MKLLNISPLMIQILGLILLLVGPVVIAADGLKPFVLAATIDDRALAEAGTEVEAKLQKAGFDLIGHSAHLPYEILVYGNHVEALYGRFRIELSWPHLPMIASDTGATFFSIMCAPGAIEDALIAIAGGSREKSGSNK